MRKLLKTYMPFARSGLQTALAYRANFLAWFVGGVMSAFVMYYVWRAVYAASGQTDFGGFAMTDMTVFLFVSFLTRFVADSDVSFDVGEEIRDGNVAMRLLKPARFDMTFLFTELGVESLLVSLVFVPTLAGVELYRFFACGRVMFHAGYFALYLVSLVLCYLFAFYMNLCFGFMAFFLKNLWGFNILKSSILRFLSGMVIPFAVLPEGMRVVMEWLPFASLSYTPVMIYMGKYTGGELALRLGMQVFWVVAFYALSQWILSLAMRHVTVQGG